MPTYNGITTEPLTYGLAKQTDYRYLDNGRIQEMLNNSRADEIARKNILYKYRECVWDANVPPVASTVFYIDALTGELGSCSYLQWRESILYDALLMNSISRASGDTQNPTQTQKTQMDKSILSAISVKIGNGVTPEIRDIDQTIDTLKSRKEVFSKLHYFLDNQERHFSDLHGFRPVAFQHNLVKAAEVTNPIPLEHMLSSNLVLNALIGGTFFSATDGNLGRFRRCVNPVNAKDCIVSLSCYAALPAYLKNAIYHIPPQILANGNDAVLKYLWKKVFEKNGKQWDDSYVADLWVESENELNQIRHDSECTEHPLIRKSKDGKFFWIQGLAAILVIGIHNVGKIQGTLRKVKAYRNGIKEYKAKLLNRNTGISPEKVLWKLSDIRPTSWNCHPDLPYVFSKYAEKRFPTGSLVGIEIEFVANSRSPLNQTYEPCGECEGCNNDGDCEDPQYSDTANWLEMPFLWFKGDGSISATAMNQVTLQYQEMNVVANILDDSDYRRVDKVLDWMNSNKMEVNKTCGLHVHLDAREMSAYKFNKKATRMEEAMINWIQFCVPFSRASNSYCKVFSGSRGDRYKAVNRTSYNKFQTLEIRIGSASLNKNKVRNWAKMLHFCFNTKQDITTIDAFLKSDASPEVKAFAISRICRFYGTHIDGRSPDNSSVDSSWSCKDDPKNKIPQEIRDIYNTWSSVLQQEGNNA